MQSITLRRLTLLSVTDFLNISTKTNVLAEPLACLSGAQMALIHEVKNGKKFCDTAPLIITVQQGYKKKHQYAELRMCHREMVHGLT